MDAKYGQGFRFEQLETFAELSVGIDDGVLEKGTDSINAVTSRDGSFDLLLTGEEEGWALNWQTIERRYLVVAGAKDESKWYDAESR